ncbi:LysR family transcriptional regulator [Kutzneria buriramensis]|uniref:DNA-binding transcriptional LysR family regulator n=1 Tax=Kutzneria buriramensis TaxID=1045776 RepID=A0A3E0HAV6_9PSEU|nr:LysR family transcriptional regulator [Kutzneria buriramensis]REH41018.1 DNA-binding transcriptional LysR family regulator [Kutzneria buriramensis]
MMDVRRLVLLRDLAEYQTVTAVADVHHVTASAVSQQLRALEAEVGKPLLLREGRTVRLTTAGQALARRCEDVLAALERAEAEVDQLAGTIDGELAVGCFSSGFPAVAIPMAETLLARHPQLTFRFIEAEPEETIPMLRQRRLDLVLAYRYRHLGTELQPGLISLPLGEDPFLICVPEPLREAVEADGLAALRDQPWVVFPCGSCREATVHACRTAGFTPRLTHTCASIQPALDMVVAGLGVTMMPAMATRTAPPGLALVPASELHRKIEVVVRAGTERQPVIEAALRTLADL